MSNKVTERKKRYSNLISIFNEKEVTPYAVAKQAGFSNVVFSEWKAGRSEPKIDKIISISNCLGMPLNDLLQRIEK